MDIIVFSLLALVLFLETLYILLRNPKLNTYNKYFLAVSILVLLYATVIDTNFYNIVRIISVLVVLTANVKLKHPDYEKPDYRYLLVLIGALVINLK
ncbi:MAG: hypothetical protein PF638_10290 [Candidatus Delongbacteria bacterium]|jgi:D-alanyl-lipoteichoic acid acyltransferase DltB (MBOAT superfamily)|nr:hypothetical protein [Candidatus Delongbacteria bacterium]